MSTYKNVIFVVLHSCSCFITDLQNNNHASIELCIQESNPIILNLNNNTNEVFHGCVKNMTVSCNFGHHISPVDEVTQLT